MTKLNLPKEKLHLKKELDKCFVNYDKAIEIEDGIKEMLKQFDTKEEKVSEVLFNVYPDEMRAIVKYVVGCYAKVSSK